MKTSKRRNVKTSGLVWCVILLLAVPGAGCAAAEAVVSLLSVVLPPAVRLATRAKPQADPPGRDDTVVALRSTGTVAVRRTPVKPRAEWAKVTAWLEVNIGTPEELINARAGLRHWSAVTDTVIVSTSPGKADVVYPALRVPGMIVSPGMKGSPIFGSRDDTRLDEFGAWQTFAAEVAAALSVTGGRTILLEMESASKPVIYGRAPIDWGGYAACLHHLPPDVSVIWYPTVWSADPLVRNRQVKLCELAGGVLRGRIHWTDLTINRPGDVHASSKPLMTARLDALELEYSPPHVGRFKIVYTHATDGRYWPYEDIVEAVRLVRPPDVVLFYPHAGRDNWVKGSEKIVTRLLKAGYPRRPHSRANPR